MFLKVMPEDLRIGWLMCSECFEPNVCLCVGFLLSSFILPLSEWVCIIIEGGIYLHLENVPTSVKNLNSSILKGTGWCRS